MQPVINRDYRKCKGHMETGVAFIVVGLVFLFLKLDLIDIAWHWYMWPALAFATMGLVELVQFKRPEKIFEGLSKIVLGGWFYAAFSGLWGITPTNSWPLILIVVGAGLVGKSLVKPKVSSHNDRDSE